MNLRRIIYRSFNDDSILDSKVFDNYSKFKYGSKTIAKKFGEKLARTIKSEILPKNLIIYSAPYLNLKTASGALTDYILFNLTDYFIDNNIQVKLSKVTRKYSYDSDYGNMTADEREKVISSDIFSIDKNIINEEDTLIFIDDIRITGSHEKRILELLEREGIKNDVIFIYLYSYTGSNPSIENKFNTYFFKKKDHKHYVKGLIEIINKEGFLFNTRVVKKILSFEKDYFEIFITLQNNTFKKVLLHKAYLNNYHTNDLYKENFNYLKEKI